jgi:thiamine-monophosphate kinase
VNREPQRAQSSEGGEERNGDATERWNGSGACRRAAPAPETGPLPGKGADRRLARPYDRGVAWNELSLQRWLARRPIRRALERGNDAAVLRRPLARAVVCVDQLVEGVHFDAGERDALVGRKACARALSDLAATAAEPRAVLLAVRAPREAEEKRMQRLIEAVDACATRYGAELVGGDLCCAPGPLELVVTAIGELDEDLDAPSRRGARAGQVVVATGAFGGSRLGRHLRFEPRFDCARWLVELGATAMMDVSDGLALDVWRLAGASKVAIDIGSVPIHSDARRAASRTGRAALLHALHDGEDHELIATLPRRAVVRALREAPDRCPGFSVLGNVRRGRGVRLPRDEHREELCRFEVDVDGGAGQGGWVHGR